MGNMHQMTMLLMTMKIWSCIWFDYSIGYNVIYAVFSWSVADEAYELMRSLAQKHKVGFFDVSGDDGDIILPDGIMIK